MSGPGRLRALVAAALGSASPLVLGRAAGMALAFGLPLLLVRILQPEAFGTYKQFFLVGQTALLVGQLGLTQSLFYFLPREGVRRGQFVGGALALLGAVAAVAAGSLYLGAPYLSRLVGSSALLGLRAPLCGYVATMLLAAPLEAALLSERRIGLGALAYAGSDLARAAALVLGALLAPSSGVFWASVAAGALRVLAFAALLGRGVVPVQRPRRASLRAQLGYALPFAGASLLQVAQRTLPQYAVSARFDAATFALYAVAAFHLPVVDLVYTPMADLLAISVAGARAPAEALRALHGAVARLAALLLPLTAAAWLFGPTVLPLLFTARYAAAVPLFLLQTAEIPLSIFPADALLRALGATRLIFLVNLLRVALAALLVLGGVRLFGVPGAIGGAIVVEAAARLAMLLGASRRLGVPLAELVAARALIRPAFAALCAVAPVVAVRHLLDDPWRFLGASLPLALATYLGVLRHHARRDASSPAPLEQALSR